ncbi:histidine kinase [Longispora sp. NPDC051575]|uniref:sensor histidine kinase n=1 Tax=Longispora sp. NPDC051575 TaxID=3154943 RepID=UPI00343B2EAD
MCQVSTVLAVTAAVVAFAAGVIALLRLRARRGIATSVQRATYEVLRTAGLAAEPLRAGLTEAAATKSVRHLRRLIGASGLALAAPSGVLAWDGTGEHHRDQILSSGKAVLDASDLSCDRLDCLIRGAVLVPLQTDSGRVGTLIALSDEPPAPGLVQAAVETGRWAATQLALAELDSSRDRLARAELRALRAQISPHFIYNALSAIASFVRTDPKRARELILEFAEFTRYSLRAHGEYTTLAEELRSIDRYLTIERARFGERLQVRLQVAPEVLPVSLPFLCLQPLVENAVRHGLSRKPGVGTISIVAIDSGAECHITVEDDGVGMEPQALLDAEESGDGQHVGLSNVDERLRSVFGEEYGLVVETGPGAGTKILVRIPKFHPAVRS